MIALPALAVALVLTKGCHETSDSEAVGLAHCHRFGAWSAETGLTFGISLTWGVGVETLVLDSVATDLCVAAGKSCNVVRSFDPGALHSPQLIVPLTALRLDFLHWGPFRAGIGVELAMSNGTSTTVSSPAGSLTLTNLFGMNVGPSIGADVRWHRIGLTGDLMPAFAPVSSDVGGAVTFERSSEFALIARGGVRVWLTPALALEATAAVNLVDVQNRTAMLRLHVPIIEPFDGQDSVLD